MKDLKSQLTKSIKLAHLELDPSEKKTLVSDLEKILDFVAIIKKTEAEGEKKFGKNITASDKEFPQIQKRNALREDFIAPFENEAGIIRELPDKKNNLIKVKKI